MVNALRGLRCCDRSVNWERRHGGQESWFGEGRALGWRCAVGGDWSVCHACIKPSCRPVHAVIGRKSIFGDVLLHIPSQGPF